MIIDFHSHIWRREWRNETMWDAMAGMMIQRLGGARSPVSKEAVKNDIFANYLDPSGERHLQQMEEAGIELTVLHPLDYGLCTAGEAPASIEEQNQAHAEVVKRHPAKFAAFVGVDPRRDNALDLLKRGITEWGFKGLKLHPAAGFYPDDEGFDSIYRKACELNVPLLIHTGHIAPPLDDRFARPANIDALAARFPELTIIAAHMAYDWWGELAEVGRKRPNVYTDISGWQPTAVVDGSSFHQALGEILKSMGAERVLFGTDGLVFGRAMKAAEWIETLTILPHGAGGAISVTETEVRAVLGFNAQRLLGI
jgi:hypothetical protein